MLNKGNFIEMQFPWLFFPYMIRGIPFTLFQTVNFRLFQIERICRRRFKIWWNWQEVLQKGRKHCGKRRNCSLQAISPFPTVFSKDLYCRHVKTRACLGKGSYLVCESFIRSCNFCWIMSIFFLLHNLYKITRKKQDGIYNFIICLNTKQVWVW